MEEWPAEQRSAELAAYGAAAAAAVAFLTGGSQKKAALRKHAENVADFQIVLYENDVEWENLNLKMLDPQELDDQKVVETRTGEHFMYPEPRQMRNVAPRFRVEETGVNAFNRKEFKLRVDKFIARLKKDSKKQKSMATSPSTLARLARHVRAPFSSPGAEPERRKLDFSSSPPRVV